MRTSVWGGPAWFTISCFVMGYPETKPKKSDRVQYKRFLTSVGDVLPCNLCRDSYKKFLKQSPLSDRVLSSRKNLVMWLFRIHNKVNRKLGCKALTTDQMSAKMRFFEKFRAGQCTTKSLGCITPAKGTGPPKKGKVVLVNDTRICKK